jgi:hypothetical protein
MEKQTQSKWTVGIMGIMAATTLMACGAAGTGVTNASSSGSGAVTTSVGTPAAAASVVGAVFGNPVTANLGVVKIVKSAPAEEGGDTCAEVLNPDSEASDSDHIETAAYAAPGAYGSLNDLLHVEEGDTCADSAGIENSGNGPDGDGRVAHFEIIADVTGSCSNADGSEDTIVMQATSTGVWRNTDEFSPQVWGHFLVSYNDEQFEIDCTLHLGDDETILYADCSDDSGTVVEQDTTAACQISTEE